MTQPRPAWSAPYPWPHGLRAGDPVVVTDDPTGEAGGQVCALGGYEIDPYPWEVYPQGPRRLSWVREVRPLTPEEQAAYWLEHPTGATPRP